MAEVRPGTRLAIGATFVFAAFCFVASSKAVRILAYASAADDRQDLSRVGFSAVPLDREAGEAEIASMVRDCVGQTLGPGGWSSLCAPGDRVLIKVNMVGPHRGSSGEKGKAIITDPRVVREVAARVREAVGDSGSILVTDTLFYEDADPSSKKETTSFYHAGYDGDADGTLDGGSRARLVNAESYGRDRRFETVIPEPTLGKVSIWLPDFMRTRDNPSASGEWSDLVIYIPVFKSHGFTGITGALKLGYGLRTGGSLPGDSGRSNHSGYGWGTGNKQLLIEYLCAQLWARPCEFVIVDALTANRKGPLNGSEVVLGKRTDWIRTNAVLASKDPVAVDLALTLLAGYDPESIGLLRSAAADGLGENRPSHVEIAGGEAFGRHRRAISAAYPQEPGKKNKERTWPLHDGWGGARVRADIEPPTIASISTAPDGDRFIIDYKIEDPGKRKLARVDLVRGQTVLESAFESGGQGRFSVADPKGLALVAWDDSLNAARAEIPEPETVP